MWSLANENETKINKQVNKMKMQNTRKQFQSKFEPHTNDGLPTESGAIALAELGSWVSYMYTG